MLSARAGRVDEDLRPTGQPGRPDPTHLLRPAAWAGREGRSPGASARSDRRASGDVKGNSLEVWSGRGEGEERGRAGARAVLRRDGGTGARSLASGFERHRLGR